MQDAYRNIKQMQSVSMLAIELLEHAHTTTHARNKYATSMHTVCCIQHLQVVPQADCDDVHIYFTVV